ncbi:MAG: hypothetical protein R3208_07555 [Ketobacteraceae bacterium]|nr:hypothetical protein [Ketobacteraceae bacterium]
MATTLGACKTDYTIQSPAEGSVHTSEPEFLTIGYQKQPSSLPAVTLNGFDIRELFVLSDAQASAPGAAVGPYLKQGINRFHVAPPAGPRITFIYDTEGPEIIVLNSRVDSLAVIEGLGIDEMGLTSLSVNALSADILGLNGFSVSVPSDQVYTYVATDSLGHTRTSHYAPLGTLHEPAMTVAVSQEVIDTASGELMLALSDFDLNGLLAGTTLLDGTWTGASGEVYGPEILLQAVDLTADSAGIDLENGNGGLIHSSSRLVSQILFRIHSGFLPPLELVANTQVGPITMDADLQLAVSNQTLDVEISDFIFAMGEVSSSDVPAPFNAWVEDAFGALTAIIGGALSPQLEFLFEQAVPLMLETAIKNSYTINIPDYYTTHNLAMSLQLGDVYTTETALIASLAGGSIPVEPDAGVSQPTAGVVFKPDPLPGANLGGGQFGFSLNTNTLNQVYASAYSAGLNHMNFVDGEVQLGLPRDDDFGGDGVTKRMLVNPVAPPQVHVSDINGAAALRYLNYGLEVISQTRQADGSFADTLGVRLTTDTAFAIGLQEDSSIDLFFPYAPQYRIEATKVADGDWVYGEAADNANAFIESVIGLVLQQLTEPLANISLPSFQCVSFAVTDISAVGGDRSHLNFAGGISLNTEICGQPAGTDLNNLSYARGAGVEPACGTDREADDGLCYESCGENYVGEGDTCYASPQADIAGETLLIASLTGEGTMPAPVGGKPDKCHPRKVSENGLCYDLCDEGYRGVGNRCVARQKPVYSRAGLPPADVFSGRCPAGQEKQGGLCYTPCEPGYEGDGALCHLKTATYERGPGAIPSGCESGQVKIGQRCFDPCPTGQVRAGNRCVVVGNESFNRGPGQRPDQCAVGFELIDDRCYRECREGFVGQGAVCVPADTLAVSR